jgi:hypothetical protein
MPSLPGRRIGKEGPSLGRGSTDSARPTIRARAGHPKIAALKTYGGLRDFLKKELGQGKSFEAVGKELQVSGSRISEFVNILGIERKGKGKPDICVDRPTIGPDGEFKMEAPREKKGKREIQ